MTLERVNVVGRSPSTAIDEASKESAFVEFAEGREFDHVVLIQATSPLLPSLDIEGAIETFILGAFDSLRTVVRTKRFM